MPVERSHSCVEDLRELGVFADVVEQRFPVDLLKGGLTGLDCVMKPFPTSVDSVKHLRSGSKRTLGIGSEYRGETRMTERATRHLLKYAIARSEPQQPVKRFFVRADESCKFRDRARRATFNVIRQSQFSNRTDRTTQSRAHEHA